MKKMISLLLLGLLLSGCSVFGVHKRDVVQGNIITEEQVKRLHTGMSEAQVKEIMGEPLLSNIFTPNQIDYVYTYEPGYQKMTIKRIILAFHAGRLKSIQEEGY